MLRLLQHTQLSSYAEFVSSADYRPSALRYSTVNLELPAAFELEIYRQYADPGLICNRYFGTVCTPQGYACALPAASMADLRLRKCCNSASRELVRIGAESNGRCIAQGSKG